MAHQVLDRPFSLYGFLISGDLADLTTYKSRRGKIVTFAKTWPKKPATPAQEAQRQRFRDAAQAWQALTPAARAQWELATLRASLCLNGYDLFVHWHTTQDELAIRTLERQTHTQLLPP